MCFLNNITCCSFWRHSTQHKQRIFARSRSNRKASVVPYLFEQLVNSTTNQQNLFLFISPHYWNLENPIHEIQIVSKFQMQKSIYDANWEFYKNATWKRIQNPRNYGIKSVIFFNSYFLCLWNLWGQKGYAVLFTHYELERDDRGNFCRFSWFSNRILFMSLSVFTKVINVSFSIPLLISVKPHPLHRWRNTIFFCARFC